MTRDSIEPDYRTILTKFMHTLWELNPRICELCAAGSWRPYEPHEQVAVDEILTSLKKDAPHV